MQSYMQTRQTDKIKFPSDDLSENHFFKNKTKLIVIDTLHLSGLI